MPDEHGETRRERNARFDFHSEAEDYDVPEAAQHVWEWFFAMTPHRKSGPEPLGDYVEVWQRLTGIQMIPEEVAMIMAMDVAFVSAMRKEQSDAHKRVTEKNKTKGK